MCILMILSLACFQVNSPLVSFFVGVVLTYVRSHNLAIASCSSYSVGLLILSAIMPEGGAQRIAGAADDVTLRVPWSLECACDMLRGVAKVILACVEGCTTAKPESSALVPGSCFVTLDGRRRRVSELSDVLRGIFWCCFVTLYGDVGLIFFKLSGRRHASELSGAYRGSMTVRLAVSLYGGIELLLLDLFGG